MLEVNNLCKSFDGRPVLKNISFSLGKGEIMCLRGKSGAGKTTLIRCICNLETADSGNITINGIPSVENGKANRKYQDCVGMVSQGLDLFPNLTVMENITLAPVSRKLTDSETARHDAISMLSSLGIADKADSYPKNLSGGERQRVAVARACVLNPSVLFFDEPTSALDVSSAREVANLIGDIAQRGISVVIISHDENFCSMLNARTIVVKDGTIE